MYSSFFVLERVKTLSSKISGEFLDEGGRVCTQAIRLSVSYNFYHLWTVDPSLSNLSRWLVLQFIGQLVLCSVLVRQGRTFLVE